MNTSTRAVPAVGARPRVRPAAALLIVALVMGTLTVSPSRAEAVVPPSSKTISLDATFSTTGQSLWGAGDAAPPATQNISLFDEAWDSTKSGGAIESVDLDWSYEAPCFPDFWNLCDYYIDFGHIGDFGAKGTGTSKGRIGMSIDLEGASGGTIGVDYPVTADFTMPADKTFGAGDTIEISTAVRARPGGTITVTHPDLTGMTIKGTFGFKAGFAAEVCIFDCFDVGQTLIDVPEASNDILSISKDQLNYGNPLKTSPPDTYCFAAPETFLLGLTAFTSPTRCADSGGYLARPNAQVATTTNLDGTLSATGQDTFVTIPVSSVTWMGRAAGLPLFPPLNLDLRNLGGTGIDLGWTTGNLIFNTEVSRTDTLTFTPEVDVTLAFPRSLSYTVLAPNGDVVSTGTGTSATLRAGNKVRLTVPADQTVPFAVTPTLTLARHDIAAKIDEAVTGSGQFKVLSLTLKTPSATFDTGFGVATVWPGTDIDVGPVADLDFPLHTTHTNVLNSSWSLGGFNAPVLAPFSLVPAPPPVVTPVAITPVEGAGFTSTIATFTDEATHAVPADYAVTIDWGDGGRSTGTITGSGGSYAIEGTHTYEQYGPYQITATLTTVPEGQLATNRVEWATSATVADAALTGTGVTNNTTAQGQAVLNWPSPSPAAPNDVVATFTDANPFGLLSDLSATIDWGDGTPKTAGVVSGPQGGPFSVSGSHDYTELGLHTVTTTLTSKGGSTATTTTTTLSFSNPTGGGTFLLGSDKAKGAVTFWGSQWQKANGLVLDKTSSFKGWANQTPPACATTWSGSSATGNSSVPPSVVPTYMAVGVTDAVRSSGSTSTGRTVAVVIVATNPGYGPEPSRTGTGTVVAVLCGRLP